MLAQLAHVVERTEASAQREQKALAELLAFQKPVCFQEGKSLLVQLEKSYQKLTYAIAEGGCSNPSQLSVFELYGWQEALEEKYKPVETPKAHAPKR